MNNIIHIQKFNELAPSEDFKDYVMHSELELTKTGGIAGSDTLGSSENATTTSILIRLESNEKANNVWNQLVVDGEVIAPLEQIVLPDHEGLMGTLKDKYGVTWIFTVY